MRNVLLCLGVAAFACSAAHGQLGGQFFATDSAVEVEVLPSSSGYANELWLFEPGDPVFIAVNEESGKVVDLGTFTPGVELVFGIRNPDGEFRMGPGARNPDGLEHAIVSEVSPGVYNVGFEDLFGGGDRDFDDCIFQFGGVVPAPGTGVLGMCGLAMVGRRSRR